MRILVLTLMMSFLSQGVFGAAKSAALECSASDRTKDSSSKINPSTLPPRPAAVQEAVDKAFITCTEKEYPWGIFPGKKKIDYMIGGIDSVLWLENYVLRYPDQENFYVLDIGAGYCGYSQYLAYELTKSSRKWQGKKTFHIISLTGEKLGSSVTELITETDKAKVLSINKCFKIENLREELVAQDLPIQYDFIVSHWCLIHLVDPLRVFWQAYEMLNKGSIFLTTQSYIGNGLFYPHGDSEACLILANIPYLITGTEADRGSTLSHIIYKKDSATPEFPLEYTGNICGRMPGLDSQSQFVTEYQYKLTKRLEGRELARKVDSIRKSIHPQQTVARCGSEYSGSTELFKIMRPYRHWQKFFDDSEYARYCDLSWKIFFLKEKLSSGSLDVKEKHEIEEDIGILVDESWDNAAKSLTYFLSVRELRHRIKLEQNLYKKVRFEILNQ